MKKKVAKRGVEMYRQGDVLLVRRDKMPSGLSLVPLVNGRIVLAFGEVTGHSHVIDLSPAEVADKLIESVSLFQDDGGTRYLKADAPCSLKHEEHSRVDLPAGIYEIPVQVEYTAENVRRVQD